MDVNIHAIINKITWINMLGSIPHQKFYFYHLPTRGWAEIKLGDAWYVSNVCIFFLFHAIILSILDVLWALLCTFMLFLGLTYWPRAQCQFLFFPLFQCFEEMEYQTESKRNETFWRSYFWKESNPVDLESTSRKQRGRHEAGGAPSTLVGPSWLPWRTSSAYISPYTLKTSGNRIDREFRRRKPL